MTNPDVSTIFLLPTTWTCHGIPHLPLNQHLGANSHMTGCILSYPVPPAYRQAFHCLFTGLPVHPLNTVISQEPTLSFPAIALRATQYMLPNAFIKPRRIFLTSYVCWPLLMCDKGILHLGLVTHIAQIDLCKTIHFDIEIGPPVQNLDTIILMAGDVAISPFDRTHRKHLPNGRE